MTFIIYILQFLLVPLTAPLCVGLIKKTKALLQNKQGASIFQPYRDINKLFHKNEVLSTDASWIFKVTPVIVFSVTLVVGSSIPLFTTVEPYIAISDILVIVYTLAIGTFFLALAGMDTGNAFGGFGSSREMTVSALAEGGLVLALIALALIHGSTDVFDIAQSSMSVLLTHTIPLVLVLVSFLIVLLAETARFPFDNPSTHLELTMIHEAMILEYSGKRLALMEMAAANKLVIFIALASNLFFPIGLAHDASLAHIALGIGVFLIKIAFVGIAIALLESSIAKFRFFRLPDLLFVSLVLSVISIGLITIV